MEQNQDFIYIVLQWFEDHPYLGGLITLVLSSFFTFLIVSLILKIVKKIFAKREEKNGVNLTMRYVQTIIRGALIVVAVFWVLMENKITSGLGDIIFKGSAVVGAIIGFAAQPVISDLIGGFLLSISKAFQIGDRIELEDGTAGIVRDITFRHVVLEYMDKRTIIIPNSKLSGMRFVNCSRTLHQNSFVARIGIAYGSDVRKAMKILEKIVHESPFTIPGKEIEEGERVYTPAYFLEYGESALYLAINVCYPLDVSTEVVRSDINLRIDDEFRKNNIEIPFNYVNVIMKPTELPEGAGREEPLPEITWQEEEELPKLAGQEEPIPEITLQKEEALEEKA